MLREELLDVRHDLRDALFLLQDARGELFGREMGDVFLRARVFAVEVADGREQLGGGDFPCALIFLAARPPCDERGEFLELDGRGFGLVFPALGEWVLVIPDFARRPGAVEEKEVRGDAGVGREDAVREADDGVEIERAEQFVLDARADAIAEERAIRDDDGGARIVES